MLNQRAECQVRRWTLVIFVVLLVLAGAVIAKGETFNAIRSVQTDMWAPYRAVCQISTASGQGSGTLIARRADGLGLVLTCRHVAEHVGNHVAATFLWAGSQSSRGEVVAVQNDGNSDFNSDLALVVIRTCPVGVQPCRVVRFDHRMGPWVGAGFRGGWMRITPPTSAVMECKDGSLLMQTTLVKGMSGGSLFNNRGEVVGVTVGSDFVSRSIAGDGVWLHSMLARFAR